MKIFQSIIIILIVLPALSGCKRETAGAYVFENDNPLRVGIELSPMTLTTSGDSIEGFSYDILKIIANEHDIKLDLAPYSDITEAVNNLESGNIDLLISDKPLTAENKGKYLYTVPVYSDLLVLIQNTNDTSLIHSPHELADSDVYIANVDYLKIRLKNLSEEIGAPIHIIELEDATEETLILKVATHEISRAVVGKSTAMLFYKNIDNLDCDTELSFSQLRCWQTMLRDSVLCDSLNVWLTKLKESPEYTKIVKKYMKNR